MLQSSKVTLTRENILCYWFFAPSTDELFSRRRSTEFFDFTSEKGRKITNAPNGLTYDFSIDSSGMFPMVTRENSAKVQMLRIRSRIYDLPSTSSDMFGCSSTELKETP